MDEAICKTAIEPRFSLIRSPLGHANSVLSHDSSKFIPSYFWFKLNFVEYTTKYFTKKYGVDNAKSSNSFKALVIVSHNFIMPIYCRFHPRGHSRVRAQVTKTSSSYCYGWFLCPGYWELFTKNRIINFGCFEWKKVDTYDVLRVWRRYVTLNMPRSELGLHENVMLTGGVGWGWGMPVISHLGHSHLYVPQGIRFVIWSAFLDVKNTTGQLQRFRVGNPGQTNTANLFLDMNLPLHLLSLQ